MSSTPRRAVLLRSTALVLPALLWPHAPGAQTLAPGARPEGGRVVAGGAAIAQDAARTGVTQTTDRAVIDWRRFDIGRDHVVQFQQPSAGSIALNRVTTPEPSVIAGRLQANGQVAIVNQSGVVFSQGAQVEVGGLIASTADIANEAFMRGGRLHFDRPGRPDARIENRGGITVRDAGLAALVAPQVANRGTIRARAGRVALAGGETAVVDLNGDGLLSIAVTGPVRRAPADGGALVANTGTIEAEGGTVLLTAAAADGIVQDLVRAGGRISAGTDPATGRTGRVLVAGTGGTVRIEGEVSATGTAAGTRGGTVEAVADRVLVAPGAVVDTSGRAGGGAVGIGIAARATAATAPRLARRAGVAAGATVRADATERGPGGDIRVNATDYALHAGTVSVRGGPAGGDGGFVEVSSGGAFHITGTTDLAAPMGRAGSFLIDPVTLEVVTGSGSVDERVGNGDFVLDPSIGGNDATISAGVINRNAGNLVLQTRSSSGSSSVSTITVSAAIDKPSGGLTLDAGADDFGNANNGFTGSRIRINQPIALGGGTLRLQARDIAIGAALTVPGTAGIVLSGGSATQTGAGSFGGGTLAGSLSGSAVLRGDNRIAAITSLDAGGALDFRNLQSLAIERGFTSSSSYARVDVLNGDLTVAGLMRGAASTGEVNATTAQVTGNLTVTGTGAMTGPRVVLYAGANNLGIAVPSAPTREITIAGQVGGADTSDIQIFGNLSAIRQTGGEVRGGAVRATILGGSAGTGIVGPGLIQLGLDAAPMLADYLSASGTGSASLIVAPLSGSDVVLGTLSNPAGVSVRATAGNLVQATGEVITTSTASFTASGGVALLNDNRIGALGASGTTFGFRLRNVADLTITGDVSGGESSVRIEVTGNLSVAGTGRVVSGGDPVLLASGNLRLEAGSRVESSFGGMTLQAGYEAASEGVNPGSGTVLVLDGTLSSQASFGGVVTLGAGTGGIVQGGTGRIEAQRLQSVSGGAVLLNQGGATGATPNGVASVAGASAAGDFVLDNGDTAIRIDGAVSAANIALRTSSGLFVAPDGSLSAPTGRVSLRSASLNIGSGSMGGGSGSIAGSVVEAAPDSPAAMRVAGSSSETSDYQLTFTTLGRISATDTLRLGATTFGGVETVSATNLSIRGEISANRLDLRSLGGISQDTPSTVVARRLTGSSGGQVRLGRVGNTDGPLEIGDFGNTAGGITIETPGSMTVSGLISAPGQGVALRAVGPILSSGTGRVEAGDLALVSGTGAIALTGDNRVSFLGATSGVSVQFRNLGNLVLSGPVTATGPTGFVPGDAPVRLDVAGTLTQAADAPITGSSFSGSATEGAILDTALNDIGVLGDFVSRGEFRFRERGTLTVGSTLDAAGQSVTLIAESGGIGNDLVSGIVVADRLNLSGRGLISLTGGSLAGPNQVRALGNISTDSSSTIVFSNGGALAIEGSMASSSGRPTLSLTAAGPITQTATSRLEVTRLDVTATGAVSLLSPLNEVPVLGTVDAPDFALATATALRLDGPVTVPGTLRLESTGALENGGAATVAAGTLTGRASGVQLSGGGVAIGAIGDFTVADGFLLDQGGALTLTGLLDAPGRTVVLRAASVAAAEGSAGRIVAGRLSVTAVAGAVSLPGDNAVAVLADSSAPGDFAFRNAGALRLEGGVTTPGTLRLESAGALTNDDGATVAAGTLTGRATEVRLSGEGVAIGAIGDFAAAQGFALNQIGALTLTGTLDATGAAVLLNAGSVGATGAGRVLAQTLAVRANDGAVSLSGDNAVARLLDSAATGDFAFRNAGDLLLDGTLSGAAIAAGGEASLEVAGRLTQTAAGAISAGRLSGRAGAGAILDAAANGVAELGDFASGGAFRLRVAGGLLVGGTLDATGQAVTLTAGSGSIGARILSGRLLASRLDAAATGGIALVDDGPAHRIDTLGTVTAGESIFIVNGAAMTVAGPVRAGTTLTLAAAGDLSVAGPLAAGGATSLRSGGAMALSGDVAVAGGGGPLSLEAGAGIVQSGGTLAAGRLGVSAGGAVSLLSAGNALPVLGEVSAPDFALATAGALRLDGAVRVPGTLRLDAAGALVQGPGASIEAGLLAGRAAGAELDAALGGLGDFVSAGDFRLATPGALTLNGLLDAAGRNVSLSAASIGAAGTGRISAATLDLTAREGGVALSNGNAVGTLRGSAAATDFAFRNLGGLRLDGLGAAPAVRAGAGGTVRLDTDGALAQTATGAIRAETLTGTAGGGAALTAAGNGFALGDFASGGAFLWSSGDPLLLSGTLDAAGQAVTLAGPGIAATGGGRVLAASLALDAGGGSVLLGGDNRVAVLGRAVAGGSIDFANGGDLTLGPPVTDGASAEAIVAGGGLSLSVRGTLRQTALGAIRAASLSGGTDGDALLADAANGVAVLDGFASGGDFRLRNAGPGLTLSAGRRLDAGGAIRIDQSGGGLTVDGTATGTAVELVGDARVAVNGFSAIARAGDLLLQAPEVAVDGLVSATGGILVRAGAAALAGRAEAGAGMDVEANAVRFGGLDAGGSDLTLRLGGAGTANGRLAVRNLLVVGGGGAALAGSIGGDGGDTAAALGRRGDGATVFGDPPPDAGAFLFNGCPIGAAGCGTLVAPPVTLIDNPSAIAGALDPAAQAAVVAGSTRATLPDITVNITRDRTDDGEIAPPNVRGEDY